MGSVILRVSKPKILLSVDLLPLPGCFPAIAPNVLPPIAPPEINASNGPNLRSSLSSSPANHLTLLPSFSKILGPACSLSFSFISFKLLTAASYSLLTRDSKYAFCAFSASVALSPTSRNFVFSSCNAASAFWVRASSSC